MADLARPLILIAVSACLPLADLARRLVSLFGTFSDDGMAGKFHRVIGGLGASIIGGLTVRAQTF